LFLQLPHAYTNEIREAKISNINKPFLRDAANTCCGYFWSIRKHEEMKKLHQERSTGNTCLNSALQTDLPVRLLQPTNILLAYVHQSLSVDIRTWASEIVPRSRFALSLQNNIPIQLFQNLMLAEHFYRYLVCIYSTMRTKRIWLRYLCNSETSIQHQEPDTYKMKNSL
jgi:hypothetical protein